MKKPDRTSARIAVAVIALVVAALCFVSKRMGLPFAEFLTPWRLIVYSVAIYIMLNLLLFHVTLFRSFQTAAKATTEDMSEEEREQVVEEIVAPAMQGEVEPNETDICAFRWPVIVCYGLGAAGVLCALVGFLLGLVN